LRHGHVPQKTSKMIELKTNSFAVTKK